MVGVLMTRTFDKVTKKSAKVDSTFSFYLMHAFLTDPQLKMMQSIADAEQPFGSGRIELAPSIQPFHICLLLLLLLHVLFLLLHILHLLLILILLLTTASPPVFLLKFKSFIPSPLSPSRNSNPTPSYFLASRALPSPLTPF